MKFANGNTLQSVQQFNANLKRNAGRFDTYQSGVEFGTFHAAKHGNDEPMIKLFSSLVGQRGKLVGDGPIVRQYVLATVSGFTIGMDGSVERKLKKNGKPIPCGFKQRNDQGDITSKKLAIDSGCIMSFERFMKEHDALLAKKKEEAKKAKDAAKAAKAELEETENGEEKQDEKQDADYSKASVVAKALREIEIAFRRGQTADISAIVEAQDAARDLLNSIGERLAFAQQLAHADDSAQQPEQDEKQDEKQEETA